MKTRTAFTLIELAITVSMVVILIAVSMLIFRTVLLSWSGEETRAGIDAILQRAVDEVARDLREAKAVQSSNDEIRFTQDESAYYIYYLYNANDPYPLSFDQDSYQLKRAPLTGGMAGAFTYGSGNIIATDLIGPPTTDMSMAGNIITVDLSMKWNDETIRSITEVRPRNL